MSRSLKASKSGIEKATSALTDKYWSKDQLAGKVALNEQTVNKFFRGKSIDRKNFAKICQTLDLEWKDIAEIQPQTQNIEALVQKVRQTVASNIQGRCGVMRVLDMKQPIELGDIYTSVNILGEITVPSRQQLKEQLLSCDLAEFDRLQWGDQQKRVAGLKAVEQHSKLMILGKPGAGKTTFLKRLAIRCNNSKDELQNDRVPVFITLKDFAEAEGQPNLLTYIADEWTKCGLAGEVTEITDKVLREGKAFVLLDALDEVRETDHGRVTQEIKNFAIHFSSCQFVITCRIAAQEYVFEQFTAVKVADFDDKQIKEFSTKWFETKEDAVKAKTFIQKLEANKPVKELANNPLLLTLLCWVYGDLNDFPRSRSELYQDGLDVLLKKWDATRNIERDEVYRNLSLRGKQDLLSQLAFETFDKSENFFKKRAIEEKIAAYIDNLKDANPEPEARQKDSEDVLKAIEAHHGLLVERTRGIYSFSHLTFQEYFTAKKITGSTFDLQQNLESLASHITEKRWREIFLLAVEMLRPADGLLKAMKAEVDKILDGYPKLQEFLEWVQAKSESVEATYKPAAIRASYFAFALDRALDRALALALDRDLDLARALDRALFLSLGLDLDFATDHQLKQSMSILLDKLPDPKSDSETRKKWREANEETWEEELRKMIIDHHNTDHSRRLYFRQFDDGQKQKLLQYYDANKLLVDCLNSDCYVTRSVREEIEDTLLLPLAEIEKKSNK